MNWFSKLFSSSIGKKLVMALTGLFLITFLVTHLSVNLTLFGGPETFNAAAHFMATNPFIQGMQYILAAGFLFHIVYGIRVTVQNKKARPIKYLMNKPQKNSNWAARNMIISGIIVLLFLVLHIKDFFIPIKTGKVGHGADSIWESDYEMVTALFKSPAYTAIYLFSFVLLAVHLYHGFQSAFNSVGVRHSKYTPFIKKLSTAFCIIVAVGFSAIAIYFYFN